MTNNNIVMKSAVAVVFYWLISIIIPGCIAFLYRKSEIEYDFSGYIAFYILFLGPFLFIIPYKLLIVNIERKTSRLYFFIFGLCAPYLVIYIFLIYKIMHVGAPRF